ncbi:DUF440 family protein [Roseateles sp. P5_E7]
MRDKSKRYGLTTVMRMAEKRVLEDAQSHLSADRLQDMLAASREGLLFTSGRYPDPDWREVCGFEIDQQFHYEVIVGVAVEPTEPHNLFAKVLISRDADDDVCFIVWDPAAAQPFAAADGFAAR